ncbi:MAG: hypothetical protein GQ537_01380 [Gammaproteobacteria bacterium]|nr:hypothetical protein [Gammaproteobacteria bacterium]
MKKRSALVVGSIAIGLLLGTNIAQAEDVCYNDDGVAIGIKGLNVVTKQFGQIDIDVDLTYRTGFQVYGTNLDGFPFDDGINEEEDSFSTLVSINETLNDEVPVPDFVGVSGQRIFYIGVEEETGLNQGLIAVWGGENLENSQIAGQEWDPCGTEGIGDPKCISGAAITNATRQHTYADLTLADGSTCDAGPPTTGFEIIPGISGSWYDPGRDGEGYNFEILDDPSGYLLYAYYYTYDDTGNQMWVTGTGPVNGDTAVVEMLVTSGAKFGDAFRKEDVIRQDWGTMTFKFSSCLLGSVDTVSSMGNFSVDFGRLTYVADLPCP